jgi:hypothetical protein
MVLRSCGDEVRLDADLERAVRLPWVGDEQRREVVGQGGDEACGAGLWSSRRRY